MNNLKRILKNPRLILTFILFRYCHWIDDKTYLRILYFIYLGKWLHLNSPRTFNEKLQWLKLYDHRPEYTRMVDKVTAKEYVAEIIGEEYIIPTLGVWSNFDNIDFKTLPNQFVLKCTHDSGGLMVCKDKEEINITSTKAKINKSLSKNYFYGTREYPYRNVPPRILAEKYIESESHELQDYKFMCFNGKVRCSFVCSERFSKNGLKVTFFDRTWNRLPFLRKYPNSKVIIPKPCNYDKMVELAEIIAGKIMNPFVRIDFYDVNGKIYFGEITFYPGSGLEAFYPAEWDRILGDWIKYKENYND